MVSAFKGALLFCVCHVLLSSMEAASTYVIPLRRTNMVSYVPQVIQRRSILPQYAYMSAAGRASRLYAGKNIIMGKQCRHYLREGINQVAEAVRVTLGPRGRSMLLQSDYGGPTIVNDGVTICRNVSFTDNRLDVGAKLVQQSAASSDDRVGDGTTSTTILTNEIVRRGMELVNKGANPVPLAKGIRLAANAIVSEVKGLSAPVKSFQDLFNIASVATSGDKPMANIISEAFNKLGKNAATVIEDSSSGKDELEFVEGYTFDRGIASPYFLIGETASSARASTRNNAADIADGLSENYIDWKNSRVIVCDYKIENVNQIVHILEEFVKTKEPLLLIADDFSNEIIQTLVLNKLQGRLKIVAVRAPSFGDRRKEYLRDICAATGAEMISQDLSNPLEKAKKDTHSGFCRSVVVKKDSTSLLVHETLREHVSARVAQLQEVLKTTTSKYDSEKLTERIAALSNGVAKILIGGRTESEQKERRFRFVDAIRSIKAAMEQGFVPGGGVTYLRMQTPDFKAKIDALIATENQGDTADISKTVPSEENSEKMMTDTELMKMGAAITLDSMSSITRQIADNAGVDGSKVVSKIVGSGKDFGYGWNAKTNRFEDMIVSGVIDAAKVIISATENSASISALVLTTEGMMVDEEEKKDKSRSEPNNYDGMM